MNHISSKWLKKLRWLFLLYSSQYIWIYLYIGLRYHEWHGTKTFPIQVVIFVALQVIYEIFASFKLVKKYTYITTSISAFLMLLENAIVFNPTGVYYSPYILTDIAMSFVLGTLGWLLPLVLIATMFTFALFGLSGFLKTPVPITTRFLAFGITELSLILLLGIAGYFFWRRYYDLSENTELRRLTARLKRGTQQSTAILNSIGDGVIVFDSSGAVDLINPPATVLTGYEVKEALGVNIAKIVKYSSPDPQSQEVALPDYFDTAIKEKKHLTETVKLDSSKIQRSLVISLSISPIIIPPNNELIGGVAILHDVTKEMEIEQQRSDFISTASHEMRTPLATIEGYLDLALSDKKHPLEEPLRGYVDSAHKSTEHLGKLFQDLLSSSRAEDGNLTNHPKLIDLREFLEQFSEDFRYSTKKYGLEFEFITGASEVIKGDKAEGRRHLIKPKYYVYADPERLRELINNLFENAIKFTQKGKISVGISGNQDSVQLFLRDSGVGIPGEDIAHLFQKFYRVDNSPTRTIGGTGLGLFICRKIVELYGGRIWVESTLGEGSTFYISLPRLSEHQVKQLKAEVNQNSPASEPKATGTLPKLSTESVAK